MWKAAYDVVVVHYKDVAGVTDLVRRIREWSKVPDRIVVVDNSGELSPESLPGVFVIAADNPGYGAAVNIGLGVLDGSGAGCVLLATQDVAVAPDAVEHLLRCLETHPEAAVAAPLLVFRADDATVFSAGGIVDAKGRTYHAGFRAPTAHWIGRPDIDVAWADGAFLLVRKSALESVGGLREDFFLYFEEVELQLRLRLRGWSVRLVPTAVCAQQPGNFTAYLRVRNRMLLVAAYPYYFDQRLRFSLLETVRTCALSVRDRRWSGLLWAWRGLLDGRRGTGGKPPRSMLSRPAGPAVSERALRR